MNTSIAKIGVVWATALLGLSIYADTNYPAWWISRGVVNTNETAYDYAPLAAGQLKWTAVCAADELATNLPGGTGTNVTALISTFTSSNNWGPVTLGQLKYVALPFYDRLMEEGYATNYPWTSTATDDVDYATATLGQLKYVFDFDLVSDSDADGLPDWWEMVYFGTLAHGAGDDTDGDGVSNEDEYRDGTDPSDRFSHTPLPMLQVQGSYIVDTNGDKVVLKAVNIGGWLAWEQWMMKYEPNAYTNNMGYLSYGDMDENKAREMLIDNVDRSLALYASQGSSSNGLSNGVSSWVDSSYCPANTKFAGSFDSSDWICFSNKNFGTGGLTNLAIAIAVPSNSAGRQVQVRLGSAGGSILGTLTTRSTGPTQVMNWCAFEEQIITVSNITGNQTVFFVGAGGGGGIGNLFRFRFYGDSTNTRSLFSTTQASYFTTNDLDKIKALGYNCIRLPFFYYLLEDDEQPYQYKAAGWEKLDWTVGECSKRRLWCILDMHGTPGGVNPWHSCGVSEPFRNRLWGSEYNKDRTEKMWAAISARYATNSAIAGYDLFNEPIPPVANSTSKLYMRDAFSNDIIPMLARLHRAVRSNDAAHILFMEGNIMWTNMWEDVFWWPDPASEGWTNVVYEFHHYDKVGTWGDSYDHRFVAQKEIADRIVRTYTRFMQEKDVPVLIGEFCPVKMQNFDYFIRQFEANGIHWAHWNYRHWGWDDSTYPWSSWGLNYRYGGVYGGVNTNIQPNLLTDSLGVLSNKLSQYNSTNYFDHPYLQRVIENNTLNTNAACQRTEFYLNTFNGTNAQSLTATNAWPWRKLATVGTSESFQIQDTRARLHLETEPLLMRFRSREEADARFEVNDGMGCWCSLDICGFLLTNTVTGPEAEIRLLLARDSITNAIYSEATPGVIALFDYDEDTGSTNVSLLLYAKGNDINTYGTLLASNTTSFATGGILRLYMDTTNALISYNGVTNTGLHNLGVSSWLGGAICAVEAAQMATDTNSYVDLDNLHAWRPNAQCIGDYEDALTEYPAGIHVLAEPENLSVRTWDFTNDWNNSFITNSTIYTIPEQRTNGWTFINLKRDYQNDARVSFTATNVVEVRASYDGFTNGFARICLMPEYFPGQVLDEYKGTVLYLELLRSGSSLQAICYKQTDTGTRTDLNGGSPCYFTYVPGMIVSVQVNTNTFRVYYGSAVKTSPSHGISGITNVYANGVYPHYEFHNSGTVTASRVNIGGLRCRSLSGFTAP